MAVSLVAIASNDQITNIGYDDGDPVDLLYTSTGGTTQINQITVTVSATTPLWVAFWILPSGGSAAGIKPVWAQSCTAAGIVDSLYGTTIISGLLGQIIPAGGTLSVAAGVTNVGYVTASGIKVT